MPEYVKNGIKGGCFFESRSLEEVLPQVDIVYMTRIQKERFDDLETYERLKNVYILDEEKMKLAKEDTIIMHPLPRVNEITEGVDKDKRAKYFDQAKNGMYIRMALIMKLMSHNPMDKKYIFSVCLMDNPLKKTEHIALP